MTTSAIGHQAVREGLATVDELASIAEAWRAWSAAADGWFAVLHGEIVCTAPTSAEAKAAERTRLRR